MVAASQQGSTFRADALSSPPNIALKVQPSRVLRFSKSQINCLLMDLRHEVKAQVRWYACTTGIFLFVIRVTGDRKGG